jgi:hypothetical protein
LNHRFNVVRNANFGKGVGYLGIVGNIAACGLFVPVAGDA